ncbi:carbohydrate-binding module family 13 protein [Fomitiporia mediterranea MF3/22]|uniref:carbohydrate-binding module family 13 protein n=1 Tax=Fomitiporia mediterranea (strain MF3/22) TaxID=694068 RepID=UPI0004408F95|nr:carbohydrate-binding module family 13 protein [Fomitiporia mediterranea MF3/22]EJD01735.1 carbohydrate-binding module family 13 protein [Fomitiporia mediterranea MF3/22]
MISVKFVLASVLVAAVSAQTPRFLSPVLLEPGNNSGKCLTAASNSNGAQVTIQACTGADAQQWTFESGSVKLFNKTKCLDVTNGANVDGTKLQIWDCSNNGNQNQQFYYTGDNRLAWTNHGKCVDLTNGSQNDGNQIQVWTCTSNNANQVWEAGYHVTKLPNKSQDGQSGINNCGTTNSQTSQCQTAWINDVDDFCLWAPPQPGTVGDTEQIEVAWCTKTGRGSRTVPDGTLQGVHFVKTPDYVQVTGVGDFTKMNIPNGDEGGELDPHGPDGRGNPVGGLVFGNSFGANQQYHEWTSFMAYNEFCFRACVGPNAAVNCNHIYDVMGCYWNMPANYDSGVFESCDGDDAQPMGVYGTSTWFQGQNPTPPPHPQPSSSNCQTVPTVTASPLKKRQDMAKVFVRKQS